MKKLGLALLYFLLFILFFVVFMPKKYLYFEMEHILKDAAQTIISKEKIKEGPLALRVEEGQVFVKDIDVGDFKSVDIYPDILFNALILKGFSTNKDISLIPHISIENLYLFYTPFYPVKLFIKGEGNFGRIEGYIALKDRVGVMDIYGEPKEIKKMMGLKRIDKGHYRYEFSY